jgi:hypothetical protein
MDHLEPLCAEAYEDGSNLNQATIGTQCAQIGKR